MLEIKNICKKYSNGQTALEKINLDIKKGEFIAVLGPNGAGKSTLINIISGNVKKSCGIIKINNLDIDTENIRTKNTIGVVPQELVSDGFFNVYELLKFQSGYFGLADNDEYIDELLEALSLKDKKYTKCKELSGGMKRRLMIAKALVHKPDLFILDEPTAGVDIELRHSLYEYLKKLHNNGCTIILTTHYLEEAELLCDRTVIINHGEIVADGKTKDLIKKLGDSIEITFYFKTLPRREKLNSVGKYKYGLQDNSIIINIPRQNIYETFKKINEADLSYSHYSIKEPKLEDVFIKLTSKRK